MSENELRSLPAGPGASSPAGRSAERTTVWFLRSLGAIYFVAFLSLNRQVLPLLGHDGLLPAAQFLDEVRRHFGGSWASFQELPSIFWWHCSDRMLDGLSWVGLALSALMVAGFAHVIVMVLLWFLYMSFVHVGQDFYGYGWETMTLEAGFLAIFLCPLRSVRPTARAATPAILHFWIRWMLFRVMFGAGLIKIRGDACWRDLTCLVYHYETQPIPNPLSWYFHHLPRDVHVAGCLFNHFVELIVPWFYFGPRRPRIVAGLLTILFQFVLMLSGNLSWLNGLTIVIALPCLDDRWWTGWRRVRSAPVAAPWWEMDPDALSLQRWLGVHLPQRCVTIALSILLAFLSQYPVLNMLSPHQVMNTSFDRFHLMNTYGAFGSVGKVRREIVIEGSTDGKDWKAYEFLAKPGDPMRRPAIIAPYQSRIDWQIWFAAMEEPGQNPWLIHMIYKLLEGNQGTAGLLRTNPFPDAPPRLIRARYFEYHFAKPSLRRQGVWWERREIGLWLPPLSRDDERLRQFLAARGWLDAQDPPP